MGELPVSSETLNAKRVLCVYENHPVSTSSTLAVPRLLAQLTESLAAKNPSTEFVTICPGGGDVKGAKSIAANLSLPSRAICRVTNSRIFQSVRTGSGPESTIQYQRMRSALKPLANGVDQQTIVICATISSAILARKILRNPRIVYWVQGMPRVGQEAIASRAVAASDAIVAPSQAIYNDLFQLICRDRFAAPVWVVPNSIDSSQFQSTSVESKAATRNRLELSPDARAIMHIGRAPEKGLLVAKTALAIAKFDRPVVLISAGGKEKTRTRLSDHVEVLEVGRVSPDQLCEIYQVCDLGLVPSVWWENCPLALIEMLSLGLCTIGSRVGGIPEMIHHEQTGLLIDAPNDVAAWAVAIEGLLRDDEYRQSLGSAAKQSVTGRFDRDRIMNDWTALLNVVSNDKLAD
ncbi:MAG: glycosyltransferase family 4 protein [Rubripirellula sp.]